jgi:sarcosine oxidase subunit gamma
MDLPRESCRARDLSEGTALWLGPEEWLLLGAFINPQADCVVDVSHAFAGLDITGPEAAGTINAGCPLDLDLAAFPIGMCTRTILGKAEIILWRRDVEWFHIEIARSFAAYVLALLREAAQG